MTDIDHARCSELLGPYMRGELPEAHATEVAAHLRSCSECRSEEQAVLALRSHEPAALSEAERAGLRARVGEALAPQNVIAVTPRRSWRQRLAPAMGAAALVAAIATGVIVANNLGGSDDDANLQTSAPEEDADEGAGGGDAGTAESQVETLQDASGESATTAKSGSLAFQGGSSYELAGIPTLAPDAGRLTLSTLLRLGRSEPPFTDFRATYGTRDVRRRENMLADFVGRAPAEAGEQFRECGTSIFEVDAWALPAFGALGRYEQREVMVMGFVTAGGKGEPLDIFRYYIWPRGSCERYVDTLSGRIREP